jgi:hypothetical protein
VWWRALLLAITPLLTAALLYLLAMPAAPAMAAVVLEYFNVVPSSSAVLLEWSTLSEYNLRGFEVLCKAVNEPDSAYHRIGFFNPKGNATQGAQYDLLVTDLKPGTAYCFRLRELTTDETPGEERERCGYGLNITPTPSLPATATPTTTVGLTPTIVLFPTATLFPGITPTFDPFAPTATPTLFGASPLATPNPAGTPLGFLPGDPAAAAASLPTVDPFALPTPDPFAPPTPDPFAPPTVDPFATATVDPFAAPTVDPFATPTPNPALVSPLSTPTLTLTATVAPGPLGEGGDGAALAAQDPALNPAQVLPPGIDGSAALAEAPAPTPTSLYTILTATPVPALSNVGVAPVVTPWPTATPPATMLAGMLTPTAQNLAVMLLCFIFLSASVLGGLGLITSVLWMRSRAQRDMEELRWRARLERDRRRL